MREISSIFSRTFQDQSDFPELSRSWNFKEKNPRLSRRRGNPEYISSLQKMEGSSKQHKQAHR